MCDTVLMFVQDSDSRCLFFEAKRRTFKKCNYQVLAMLRLFDILSCFSNKYVRVQQSTEKSPRCQQDISKVDVVVKVETCMSWRCLQKKVRMTQTMQTIYISDWALHVNTSYWIVLYPSCVVRASLNVCLFRGSICQISLTILSTCIIVLSTLLSTHYLRIAQLVRIQQY